MNAPTPPSVPSWVVQMGDTLHNKAWPLILAGALSAPPGFLWAYKTVQGHRTEEKAALIEKARQQFDENGSVLMFRGAEISREKDFFAPDRDERIVILADRVEKIDFKQAEKQITEHYHNASLPILSGVTFGAMAGMLVAYGLSIATLFGRRRMADHRYDVREYHRNIRNRNFMKQTGLDVFRPN